MPRLAGGNRGQLQGYPYLFLVNSMPLFRESRSLREIYRLGERCKSGGILDRAKYGCTRPSPKDFVNFQVQGLSMAFTQKLNPCYNFSCEQL